MYRKITEDDVLKKGDNIILYPNDYEADPVDEFDETDNENQSKYVVEEVSNLVDNIDVIPEINALVDYGAVWIMGPLHKTRKEFEDGKWWIED